MVVPRLLALLLASTWVSLAAQEATRKAVSAPSFEQAPCPFTADAAVLEQVRCGYVQVPENRSSAEGRRLRLAVAIMKSLSAAPRADPVVVIGGGPGDAMVGRAPGYVVNGTMNAVRADRDVILYDQRGVGFSEPKFCPEVSAELAPVTGEVAAANRTRQRQLLARCGEYMRAAGYDLSQYNSVVSAHDLEDLRRALGYEQWNVRAASYGTRLALVLMRLSPQGIRSVVLDGPSPPNRAAWFNRPADFVDIVKRLSAACAAQPTCNEAFPDVERTLWRAADDYERAPKALPITLPTGASAKIIVDGSIIAGSIANMLERGMYPIVPLAIHAMASRDEAVLSLLSKVLATRPDAGVTGPASWRALHYTVNCFEEAPLNTAELRERMRQAHPALLTDAGIFPDPSVCEGLHQFRSTPEHSVLIKSEIPTLIFTGEFDLQTHRSNGEIVARSLKNSQLVEIPSAGHVHSWRHECTRAMMHDFYNAPLRPVDVSCLKSISPLRFITDLGAIAK